MSFKEVAALDADVVVSIGKTDRKTGKKGPTQVEGYYLGSRTTENKKGESTLHFLQTEKGNLGVWGTTDLNRKLSQVTPGTMTRITSTGTKPTPNGDMYTYKVETDNTNTIDVDGLATTTNVGDSGDDYTEDLGDEGNGVDEEAEALLAAERKAKVQAILNRAGKSGTKKV